MTGRAPITSDSIGRPMVHSADRVLRVLEAFAPTEREVSLSQLADRVDLPKSSVHRALSTLLGHGFVERDPSTRRYRLGIRLFELGSAAIHERGLHSTARPVLEELSHATGETCHLGVLSGLEAVYVYKIDGPASLSMSSRVGGRCPCHATSIGKVLAAWQGDGFAKQLRAHALRAFTANTLTSHAAFDAELASVRNQGFALDQEEFQEGLCCVAAPVRDQSGSVVAALGVAGLRRNFEGERLGRLTKLVVSAANRMSRSLGSVPLESA